MAALYFAFPSLHHLNNLSPEKPKSQPCRRANAVRPIGAKTKDPIPPLSATSADIAATKMESSSMEKEVVGRKKQKTPKNYLKCKVISMKFSSNVLMGA